MINILVTYHKISNITDPSEKLKKVQEAIENCSTFKSKENVESSIIETLDQVFIDYLNYEGNNGTINLGEDFFFLKELKKFLSIVTDQDYKNNNDLYKEELEDLINLQLTNKDHIIIKFDDFLEGALFGQGLRGLAGNEGDYYYFTKETLYFILLQLERINLEKELNYQLTKSA